MEDRDLTAVQQALTALDLPRSTDVARLTDGASGSGVYAVRLGERLAVLKITTDPDRIVRAQRELRIHRELSAPLAATLPELWAGGDVTGGIALVTTAYEPFPPSAALDPETWIRIATALGRWQRQTEPAPAWLTPPTAPTPADLETGIGGWAAYGHGDVARRAARRSGQQPSTPTAVDVTLTHGDSHVANLVRDPGGGIRWIDWQEAHRGSGLADLVFCWQRAEFDGAHPPREAMTRSYLTARGWPDGPDVRAAIDAYERRSLLLAWPPFLGYGSDQARRVMLDRLRVLATSTAEAG